MLNGALQSRLLTVDYIDSQLTELFQKSNHNCAGFFMTDDELETLEVTIGVWQRLREHLTNGEMITIDDKGRINWYQEARNA